MTLILRTQRAQEAMECREPLAEWKAHDYVVADGNTRIGRIYKTQLPAGEKWMWFLQTVSVAPPPNSGAADTLDEAKSAFKKRYAEVKGP